LQANFAGGIGIVRIDLTQQTQATQESEKSGAASPAITQSRTASNALGEDQAQLSGLHAQVQTLASQAAQLPEIRQEKVNALRQVVQGGNYHPEPGQIADAMFEQMVVEPAA
jgi:flagellar biosynthesis anti-sigma factor FlgM